MIVCLQQLYHKAKHRRKTTIATQSHESKTRFYRPKRVLYLVLGWKIRIQLLTTAIRTAHLRTPLTTDMFFAEDNCVTIGANSLM